jgi:hypothetical protein
VDPNQISVSVLSGDNVSSFVETADAVIEEASQLSQWQKSQFLPDTDGHWHLDLKETERRTRVRLHEPDRGRFVGLTRFRDGSREVRVGLRVDQKVNFAPQKPRTENLRVYQSIHIDPEGNLKPARYTFLISGYVYCRAVRDGMLFGDRLSDICSEAARQITSIVFEPINDGMEMQFITDHSPERAHVTAGNIFGMDLKTLDESRRLSEISITLTPEDGKLYDFLNYRVWNAFRSFIQEQLHLAR